MGLVIGTKPPINFLKKSYSFLVTPLGVSFVFATILYLLYFTGILHILSPLGKSISYDYYTLPRAGLAFRNGIDIYNYGHQFDWYGPFSSMWVTLPWLAVFMGVPLSFLSPSVGLHITLFLYYLIHLGVLALLGQNFGRLKKYRVRDYLLFLSLGFFYPWYTSYITGNYHVLTVLGLAFILYSKKLEYFGFFLSIIGKPILAPAGLIALTRKKWKLVALVSMTTVVLYSIWIFFHYDPENGIFLKFNTGFFKYLFSVGIYMKYTVFRWNQEMGLPKLLDEFLPVTKHLYIRYFLAGSVIGIAIFYLRKAPIGVAYSVATIWFFMLYGRSHEYHYITFLPIFLYLYNLREEYRSLPLLLTAGLTALPTVYPLFLFIYDFQGPHDGSLNMFIKHNAPLYYFYLIQRAIIPFLIVGIIIRVEWGVRKAGPCA